MAKPSLPDQKSVAWQDGGWDLYGAQPWLAAKAVFLTDGRAISAAETALVIAALARRRRHSPGRSGSALPAHGPPHR